MNYYTFYPQFHKAILAAIKHSTIRGKAKVQPGERFALRYWTNKAYRSKMGFLGTAVCTHVYPIRIHDVGIGVSDPAFDLSPSQLAKMEGFKSRQDMALHFANHRGLPFSGVLTVWDPDSFIPGPPDMDFIRWFDSQTDADWKALTQIANEQLKGDG